jgi:hypothetical protein
VIRFGNDMGMYAKKVSMAILDPSYAASSCCQRPRRLCHFSSIGAKNDDDVVWCEFYIWRAFFTKKILSHHLPKLSSDTFPI